jgi:signal transduction histidine kinase
MQQALLQVGVSHLRPGLSWLLAVLLAFSYNDGPLPEAARWWLAAASFSALAGFAFRHVWGRRLATPQPPEVLRHAEWWGIAYGSSVSLAWGCSSLLMQHGQDSNLLIAMVYFGVCAGAATLSVMGVAHMAISSVLAFVAFSWGMPEAYPSHWAYFSLMLMLYHLVVFNSARQRLNMVADNLQLMQRQEQLLAEQQRETERANQANRDKSAFLAAASHDLRQPVHAIMLLSHALNTRPMDDEARALVQQVMGAGKALSDQFNGLMELSRLEGGHHPVQAQPVALHRWLQQRKQAWVDTALAREVGLCLRMGQGLHGVWVHTDPGLLQRVLDNLLDNAIKFSPRGGRVLITARQVQGRITLGVHDQGCGIPAEQHQQVFLPHVQLANPTRDRAQGIGLGLSIVQQAAAVLQARVTLHSRSGQGSHFRVSLPADALLAPTAHVAASLQIGAPAPRPAEAARSLLGKRLLLVEDDPMVAQALLPWAQALGMQVRHARHPDDVQGLADVDLVLCDIRLPGARDGITCLTQWLDEWPDAAGLLVSAESDPEVLDRAEQEGLLLLPKPVDPDLLLHTLTGLCR